MFNGTLTVCDSCGAILRGKDRTADGTKDHIILRGNLGQYVRNDAPLHPNDSYVYWLKRIDDYSELDFCNLEHFQDFLSAKIYQVRASIANKRNDELKNGDWTKS